MSHDSNKIYASGELGISTSDVAVVLGSTSHDVGQLCTSGNINMWAKYKPVRVSLVYTGTNEQHLNHLRIANFGLNKPTYTSARDVISHWDDKNNSWEYLKPRGGADEPYRLGDFRNYLHNAEPPITNTECTEKVSVSRADKVHFAFDSNTLSADYQISFDDINLNGWYLGVVAVKEGINDVYVSTAATAISSEGDYGDFEIASSEFAVGSWIFYPVFVNKRVSTLSQESCQLVPIPLAKKMRCLVVEDAVDMRYGFVNAVWTNTSHNQIECYAELWNDMTSQQTFTNVKIIVIKGDPEGEYEIVTNHTLANATVAASGRYYYSAEQIAITYDSSKTYWVGISFDATPAPDPNYSQIEEMAPDE